MTLPNQFRAVKFVTRPLLKIKDNTEYYIQIESKLRQAEKLKNPQKDANGNEVPPPFILDIKNLEDGVSMQMVTNEVLKSELTKQYASDSYVGKMFCIVKHTKAEGKRYNTFGITEIAPVEEEETNKKKK